LLRDLPFRHARWQSLATGLLLAVPFWLLTSTIMGSAFLGAAVIAVAIVGLIVLGLVLGVALFIMVRLPLPRMGRMGLARNNLRRQQLRTIFALCALFVGVFAIGFSANTILNAQNQFTSRSGSIDGTNLAIFASEGQLDQVNTELTRYPVRNVQARYQVPLLAAQATGSDGAGLVLDVLRLEGRETPWDLELEGDPWGSVPDGVYLPSYDAPDSLPVGSTITITTPQGETRDLTLAGTYTLKDDGGLLAVSQGAVVSKDLLVEIGGTDTAVTLLGEVPTDHLRDVTSQLGRTLPDAIVFSAADLRDMITRMLKNLLIFAVVVAGLALAAGVALIANSVGLAMYERRREMGILKAVGFSSRDVLGTLLLEHGLLGFLAGILGIIAVAVAIAAINMAEAHAGLSFEIVPGLIVVALSTLLAVASAALVAWQPVRLRPLIVLRDE
jgi:putative ABC transport system permease protein